MVCYRGKIQSSTVVTPNESADIEKDGWNPCHASIVVGSCSSCPVACRIQTEIGVEIRLYYVPRNLYLIQ